MCRRTLACLLLGAAVARAGESLPLEFADGKKKTLTVEAADAEGLTVLVGGSRERIPWASLRPASAYLARKTQTSFDDGPGRLALAEFAAGLKLYPEALEQMEIALALDAIGEEDFEKRTSEISAEEVAFLRKRIDALLTDHAHPRECLAAIKRLRERYPEDENNARYEAKVTELVAALADEAQQAQDAGAQKEEDAALERLRAEVGKLQAKKAEALARAEALIAQSADAIEKRVISRIKKTLVEPQGAETYFKKARTYLRAIAKADSGFRIVPRETLQAEYEAIEKRLLACYLGVARQLMRDRNYKGAVDYVRKILYYDPIHEEALEMKAEIEKNRIHFKASDITNARPRVTGG